MLGANRLEICKDLHLDGLTPKIDVVKKIINELSIPIKVMIRPRSGSFVYNEFETLKMEQEINQSQINWCERICHWSVNENQHHRY